MQQSLIISFIANDKPGLVESISEVIAQHKGNWQESRLARLGGQFTGIVQVDINSHDADNLKTDLLKLTSQGFTLTVNEHTADNAQAAQFAVQFKVTGDDRAGIVQELSSLMANCGANIEEFNSFLASAPFSGGPLFTMVGSATLPPNLGKGRLREKMEALSDDLMVEIDAA